MTKPRDIASIRAGLHRALGLLPEERIAAATGKSASLFRKCADPDNKRHRLQAEDAVALDAACVVAGERAHILESYRQALDARVAELGGPCAHRATDPLRRVAQATRELGAIAGAVAETEQPLTPETTQRIANLVDRALDTLTHLKNDLRDTTGAAQAAV
ncbi:MAG: hypothetical protein IBJ15_07880 [Alphaproteobacteria bacterium]|nr:hypothetical protein [Alphaproteobacteria bacterium]